MREVIQGNLVLSDRVAVGQVTFKNGRIERVELDQTNFVTPTITTERGEIICPGFIDIQINGAFGKEFKSDTDGIREVAPKLPEFGVTSFCPTVTTMEFDRYRAHLSDLSKIGARSSGSRVLGLHLEGPFLNAKKVGAQSSSLLKMPEEVDQDLFLMPEIGIVTLAPELPGAVAFIDKLIKASKVVGIGHSTIGYDELLGIFKSDQMMIVHVFNAMSDLNSRNPGVVGAALNNDAYYCSIIADLVHVSPAVLNIFWKSKSDKSRIIAISDGSAVMGLSPGTYNIGARQIDRKDDRAVLHQTDTLVGSILTMDQAIRNIISVTGCNVHEAVNCVTRNPAKLLGRASDVGDIAVGCFADFVVLAEDLRVSRSYIGGHVSWSRGG